ncbi:right-handed parallel beta-helix repeat-containing protein [Rudanella paleaurantiibacter]|nr:right-handed parallel beta-helix repeat-containing protein [Rudanella paleaurantiibacter]
MRNNVAIYGGFTGTETALNQRPSVNPITGQPSSTTLSGALATTLTSDNSYHVIKNVGFNLNSTAILDGFVIAGANANVTNDTFGAGIYNSRSSPSVANCVFSGNSAFDGGGGMYNSNSNPILTSCLFQENLGQTFGGGGVYNVNSNPTLTNCHFRGNLSQVYGGGIYNEASSPALTNITFLENQSINGGGGIYNITSNPTIQSCVFIGNTATQGFGGGMYNEGSTPTVSNCLFQGNLALSAGGGLTNSNCSPTFTNCSFIINSAQTGAGIFNFRSSPTVINAILRGNSASRGGGLGNTDSSPVLINCSFQGNTASTRGLSLASFNSMPTLTNCILFDSGVGDVISNESGSVTTVQYSLIQTGVTSFTGTNNITTTTFPFLSATDLRLNDCSPAINAGNSGAYTTAGGPMSDLAENSRRYNGGPIDLGAYEYQGDLLTVSTPIVSTAIQGIPFSQTFVTTGGDSGPYNYSMLSGSLPPGLNLSVSGTLSGTPTQAGSFSLSVQIVNARGCVPTSPVYTLAVLAQPIRYVRAVAVGRGDGSSWANASADLQQMIDAVGTQQVWVAAGTYKPTSTTARTVSFSMKNGVAIYGGFSASGDPLFASRNPGSFTTTLSGDIGQEGSNTDNSFHVINNPASLSLNNTAVLDGFVVTGGNANGSGEFTYGGGMYNVNVAPTITNCVFQSNSASIGGGIYNLNSNINYANCSFIRNSGRGAGMYNTNCRLTLSNCVFSGNLAINFISSLGGGMFSQNTNLALINCKFLENRANAGGSGVAHIGENSLTINQCVFKDNGSATVSFGGGLYLDKSPSTIINSTFQSNTAIYGGGIYTASTSVSVSNCTFYGNVSSYAGWAVYRFSGLSYLINCVLFANGGDRALGSEDGSSMTARYCLFETGVTNFTGTNNLTTSSSPFVSTTDLRLDGVSAAINAGDPATTSATVGTTDLAGNPRFANGRIDMGAYEFQEPIPLYTVKSGAWDDASVWSLNRVPTSTDVVEIRHLVELSASYQGRALRVRYGLSGQVKFNPASKLLLGQL